jgi:hypothetical protein
MGWSPALPCRTRAEARHQHVSSGLSMRFVLRSLTSCACQQGRDDGF